MADQRTHDGPGSCIDRGQRTDRLRCPACVVLSIRASRRSVVADTGRTRPRWRRAA